MKSTTNYTIPNQSFRLDTKLNDHKMRGLIGGGMALHRCLIVLKLPEAGIKAGGR